MALFIRLLGRPSVERDGGPMAGPRGRKAWALLAVLLLADRPMSRRRLAELLFPETDDPLGALRWTLSQLRRGLDGQVGADGDPVMLRLHPQCRVDVLELLNGEPAGTEDPIEAGPPTILLEGADGSAGADFDLWLTAARHQVNAAQAARLRSASAHALAGAAPARAVVAATGAVLAAPHDLAGRAALVSSLVAAGDHAAALAQLREWSGAIRREVRVRQLATGARRPRPEPDPRDVDAMCRVEAGQAALAAGATAVGLAHLRDAVRLAAGRDDERLHALALFALGSALVHTVAAHAAEAAGALREAVRLARRAGDRNVASGALRDLAFLELTSGRADPARRLLSTAAQAAGNDSWAASAVYGTEGMYLTDRGRHGSALRMFRRSTELAESTGRFRQAAWSISMATRSLLLRGELEAAAEHAELSTQIAAEEHWTALEPWLAAIRAELDLASGRVDQAERQLRHAWSLSLVMGDWCWQALAARGLGLVAFARGRLPEAVRWLDEGTRRAHQDHDRYVWIHAWVQDAQCRVGVAGGLDRAGADIDRLARIADRAQLPDFVRRAERHRAAASRSLLKRP